jgi:drug/metabolite transporter (DMT)-like permease
VGESLALLSACCFAAANVTIVRGAKSQDNGAFLSILITTVIAGAIWIYFGLRTGWPQFHLAAILWFAVAGALTIFIGRVFVYASVQHLGAVRAAAIKRLSPMFSVVLGVLVLGESLDTAMVIGMLLIFASFGVLIKQSLSASKSNSEEETPKARRPWLATLANLGFFYGPVSALAYATGYVARKQGLMVMPDPAFGTMLGSLCGAFLFVLAAQCVDSYRNAVRSTFTTFNPWLYAAGTFSSVGQLLYFAAMNYTTISRVALIASLESIVTMFFTVAVFRSREQLNGPVLLAAALGVAGTVFIVMNGD